MWNKIPKEIMDELALLRSYTKKTENEASFTFCKRRHKDKLYIGSDFQGDNFGVAVGDCSDETGRGTRIGDAHSHPVVSDGVGITPSDIDVAGIFQESYTQKRKQIGCITSPTPGTDIVHCMEPKEEVTPKKYKRYNAVKQQNGKIDPYVMEHAGVDLDIALFDEKTGEKIENPDPHRVVKNALGISTRHLRRTIRDMERGSFCEYIQDIFNPKDERIHDICKTELKKKGILDYLGID